MSGDTFRRHCDRGSVYLRAAAAAVYHRAVDNLYHNLNVAADHIVADYFHNLYCAADDHNYDDCTYDYYGPADDNTAAGGGAVL